MLTGLNMTAAFCYMTSRSLPFEVAAEIHCAQLKFTHNLQQLFMIHNSWELVSPSCNHRWMNIAVGYQMRKYSYMYQVWLKEIYHLLENTVLGKESDPICIGQCMYSASDAYWGLTLLTLKSATASTSNCILTCTFSLSPLEKYFKNQMKIN